MNAEYFYFPPYSAVTTKPESLETRAVLFGFDVSSTLVICANIEVILTTLPQFVYML